MAKALESIAYHLNFIKILCMIFYVPVKLFNSVFSAGNCPSTWSQSVVCLIFKSVSKRNPAND